MPFHRKQRGTKSDYQVLEDLAFEVTPPTDLDSYNGWWVSVYSEESLHKARATDQEMQQITLTRAEAPEQANEMGKSAGWSTNDLQLARNLAPARITLITSSGIVISNAEVVRVIDGVSLVYRDGPTSGGMVRLADLPKNLRDKFGYDPTKTEAADALARQQKARWQQQIFAVQAQQAAQYASPYPQYYDSGDYSTSHYTDGGSVYVHGYYRKNGTYVNSYTRRR